MNALLLLVMAAQLPAPSPPALDAAARPVPPALEFPQPGLDDPAAYEGYRTRFYRDAAGNAVQIYLNRRNGRVVHVWADAANESLGFTARDAAGEPAALAWAGREATIGEAGGSRFLAYRLAAGSPVRIGFFLLGSMRVERDFQYGEGHLRRFDAGVFVPREMEALVANLERLDPAERRRHLALLRAGTVGEVRDRLRPALALSTRGGTRVVRAERTSLDGRGHLVLELAVDTSAAHVALHDRVVSIRPRADRPVELVVRIASDSPPLTPLGRDEIFNAEFAAFHRRARAERERLERLDPAQRTAAEDGRLLDLRRFERDIVSLELLSYREKLMAGLPNFATYFGRDMIMSALMMDPVWSDAMAEHVIASVLRKLRPTGEVSHEEALGGQAIREHAAIYNDAVERALRLRRQGEDARADSTLAGARATLAELHAVRENYRMVDDDFQLPVLAARYLADERIGPDRRRAFLLEPAEPGGESRLARLLRNLAYVVERAGPYADEPVATNLVGFPPRGSGGWMPGSWRDSDAGYAGGRFAMDVNAIWVPQALEATGGIIAALRALGFDAPMLMEHAPSLRGRRITAYLREPSALDDAVRVWRGAERHFVVRLPPDEARDRVLAKLAWMPEPEHRAWRRVLERHPIGGDALEFLAVALDGEGRPIPVMNTDPATRLFLEDGTFAAADDDAAAGALLRDVRTFTRPYPVGLFVEGLGPLVANDAYASREVWARFDRDRYHSPYVVWGREVNLILLGLARRIDGAAPDGGTGGARRPGRVAELRDALRTVLAAVDASGLRHHELWSYRIEGARAMPVRYGTSTDIQLWNLTDLAVRFALDRLDAGEEGT